MVPRERAITGTHCVDGLPRREPCTTACLEKNRCGFSDIRHLGLDHAANQVDKERARQAARPGEAWQNRMLTFRSAWKPTVPLAPQGTVNKCSELLFASTNKGNPIQSPVDQRLTRVLSVVHHQDRERSSLLALDQCTAAYVCL